MMLIGCVTVLGVARVAQQTALWLKAYDVGRRTTRVHRLENQTQWLGAQVGKAESPLELAHAARERKLELVAWSAMPVPVSLMGRAAVPTSVAMVGTSSVMDRPAAVRLARDGQND